MALFGKREVSAQVTGLAWRRVIELERRQWEAGRSTLQPPPGARNIQQRTERSLGLVPGTAPGPPDASGMPGPAAAMKQEWQIRSVFTYEEPVWHKWRTLTAEGTDPSTVAWPDYEPDPDERIASREESYQATLVAGDKQYETSLPEQEWRGLEPGASYQLTLGLLGGVKKVAPARS
jgi:hypothetical protein